MLIKNSKHSLRLFYSSFFILILIYDTGFADSNEEFVRFCEEMTHILQTQMEKEAPSTKAYEGQPFVAANEQFSKFVVDKIELLAQNLYTLYEKYRKNVEKEYFFTINEVNPFLSLIKGVEIFRKKSARKNVKLTNGQILYKIIGEYPRSFFHYTLGPLLWKFNENELEKVEMEENEERIIYVKFIKNYPTIAEYEGSAKHSTKDALVPEKYVKLRRCINAYIKELKMEIVYGQGVGAFSQMKEKYAEFEEIFKNNFNEFEKEAENFVKENLGKMGDLLKEIKSKEKKKLEREKLERKMEKRFAEIAKKNEDFPREYRNLYLYNLLNNASNELRQNLEGLVSEAVDRSAHQTSLDDPVARKEIPKATWALAELIVKPKLRQALNGEMAMMPLNTDTSQFVLSAKNNPGRHILVDLIDEEASSSNKGKKMATTNAENLKYPLVNAIKENLELPSNYFKLEGLLVNASFLIAIFNVHRKNIPNDDHSKAVRESHIRFAAAKVLLAYERLKDMYFGKNDLVGEKLELTQVYAQQAMDTFLMSPMKAKSFGELIGAHLLAKKRK